MTLIYCTKPKAIDQVYLSKQLNFLASCVSALLFVIV
jgi:hypothetical protein